MRLEEEFKQLVHHAERRHKEECEYKEMKPRHRHTRVAYRPQTNECDKKPATERMFDAVLPLGVGDQKYDRKGGEYERDYHDERTPRCRVECRTLLIKKIREQPRDHEVCYAIRNDEREEVHTRRECFVTFSTGSRTVKTPATVCDHRGGG